MSGYVRTVNSIPPDISGNVEVTFSDPIQVENINTIDDLRAYGDKTEKYVLEDGYIYSYRVTKVIPKGSLLSDNKLLKAEDFPYEWTNRETQEKEQLTEIFKDTTITDGEYKYQIDKTYKSIKNRALKAGNDIVGEKVDGTHGYLCCPATVNQTFKDTTSPALTPYVTGLIPVEKGDIIRI